MNAIRLAALAIASCASVPVLPEALDVSAAGFEIKVRREIAASPATVYQTIGQIGTWWNSAHTWSGNAGNLSLRMEASGCFCERWNSGSVEHGRVIHAAQDSLLLLQSALGPLQAMPVSAILTFELAAADGKTMLVTTYRVAGAGMDLRDLAQPVDGVITEQVDRLARLITTGNPEKK